MSRLFALALLVLPVTSSAQEATPRNVVMVVADDMGFQAGCYGDSVARTPNLDRLAAEGTMFTRAHATTASCSPSRSVILSGLHNHATGLYGLSHREHHFAAYESVPTLPVLLAEAGYRTCSIGKYHVAPDYVYKADGEDYLQRPRFELYDLKADPGESTNLAGDPEHRERLARMQAEMKAWQKETGDPWGLKWEYE